MKTKKQSTDVERSVERQIADLAEQALQGNTTKNRHLALVQLFAILVAQESDTATVNLLCTARDSAIKHASGLTETIASMLTNSPVPGRSEFDDADVLPIAPTQESADDETNVAGDPQRPLSDDEIDRLVGIVLSEGDDALSQRRPKALLVLADAMQRDPGNFPFWLVRKIAFAEQPDQALDAQAEKLRDTIGDW